VLAAGLSMLTVIEDSGATDLRFDAAIGRAVPAPPLWSPSRLEILGACPQHYFFRHTLRVDELEEPADDFDLDAREIGAIVHAVLHDVYGRIFGTARPGAERIGEPAKDGQARGYLEDAWKRSAAGLAARMRTRYPLLWESISAHLTESLRSFLDEDLAALAAAGARVVATEEEAPAGLDLGGGRRLEIRGRFDRIVRRRDGGLVVSDYKSSGNLDRHVSITEALKGIRLQMPLYLLMAETLRPRWGEAAAPIDAEVLGVGPAFEEVERRAALDPEKFELHRGALLESISVLLGLAEAGHYPLNRGSRLCRACPYLRACRRNHPPTLDRLAGAPAGRDYALLKRKSTRASTLAAAGAAAAGQEP
jgi:RecB family exonuclease